LQAVHVQPSPHT